MTEVRLNRDGSTRLFLGRNSFSKREKLPFKGISVMYCLLWQCSQSQCLSLEFLGFYINSCQKSLKVNCPQEHWLCGGCHFSRKKSCLWIAATSSSFHFCASHSLEHHWYRSILLLLGIVPHHTVPQPTVRLERPLPPLAPLPLLPLPRLHLPAPLTHLDPLGWLWWCRSHTLEPRHHW